MKRFLVFCSCICIILSCVACKPATKKTTKTTTLNVDSSFVIDDYAKFSIFRISTTDKVTPTMGGNFCYNNKNENETYVDVVLEWTNISGKTVNSNKAISISATNNNEKSYATCFYSVETSRGTDLDQSVDIEPMSTVRLHCTLSVPKAETTLTLKLSAKTDEFTYLYTVGQTVSAAKSIAIGETLNEPDHATLVLRDIFYTDDVVPSNTDGMYFHYTVKDPANTYLVIKMDVTNLESASRAGDDFVNIHATYESKYSYRGSVYVEDEDQRGFSPYEDILSLSTRHFYYLIEVPKTVTEHEATITIAFAQHEYVHQFNK